MNKLIDSLEAYECFNEQERKDKAIILDFLKTEDNAFERTNLKAHMTSSSWIVNKDRTKVLMVYHNIYDSFSWTGGHADGKTDLLEVAISEAEEETGVKATSITKDIFSIEILTVDGHIKNNKYVPSHLHMNITYLLEADEKQKLRIKEDENSQVSWFTLKEALEKPSVNEKWIVDNIYRKLNAKLCSKFVDFT